jgi:oligosaccharyltransferase complex subunit gamma
MWNKIRGAQYQGHDGQFIMPGFSQQYVMETQIVGAICKSALNRTPYRSLQVLTPKNCFALCVDGLLAFSTVALTTLAPKMLGSYRQRFAIYIWVGVTLFIFSFLVKVFKIKNGGYPFRLLLG